jgi:rhodanese-related sulfurtransferase
MNMALALAVAAALIVGVLTGFWIKAARNRRDLEQHSITAEGLYQLMMSKKDLMLFDVRQPLDLLADSEIIPGAKRVPPKDMDNEAVRIPKDLELFVYCTCPNDATARLMSRRARDRHFTKVKFLRGGLAAWKARGYPVEPYNETFRLDTATTS